MDIFEYLSRFSLPLPGQVKGLVSFDFDGTLFSDTWTCTERIRLFDLLINLREKGVIWGINTGRNLPYLGEGIRDMFQGVAKAFAPDFLITMERHVHLKKGEFLVSDIDWNHRCDDAHEALFRHHGAMLDSLLADLEFEFSEYQLSRQEGDVYSLVVNDAVCMDAVAEKIDNVIAPYPEIVTQRAFVYLRFSHKDFNKGTALRHLVRYFGLDLRTVVIFGDGHNDLDAMAALPEAYCCCPSNAVSEVRQAVGKSGGFVSQHSALTGVLEGLELGVLPRI